MPPEHLSSVVCISCFARLADEKLIPWDQDIQLYPVSMHTHLMGVKPDLAESASPSQPDPLQSVHG